METNTTNDISTSGNAGDSKATVPGAIVVAGMIIALAIFLTGSGDGKVVETGVNNDGGGNAGLTQAQLAEKLLPVTANEHILGNPKAPVKIVEFSDLECPFCQRFHPVLQEIMEEYGKDGRVAWVYRHFPLARHPNAMPEAVASECVASVGGNVAFWKFVDKFFAVSLVSGYTPKSVVDETVASLGINMNKYNTCMADQAVAKTELVNAQMQNGVDAGVSGTPYTIIVANNGKKFVINGALPLASVKAAIDAALAEK